MRRPWRRFLFSLARELGMTVRQLLGATDARELAEWMALARIEARERAKEGARAPEGSEAALRAELKARAKAGVATLRGR